MFQFGSTPCFSQRYCNFMKTIEKCYHYVIKAFKLKRFQINFLQLEYNVMRTLGATWKRNQYKVRCSLYRVIGFEKQCISKFKIKFCQKI